MGAAAHSARGAASWVPQVQLAGAPRGSPLQGRAGHLAPCPVHCTEPPAGTLCGHPRPGDFGPGRAEFLEFSLRWAGNETRLQHVPQEPADPFDCLDGHWQQSLALREEGGPEQCRGAGLGGTPSACSASSREQRPAAWTGPGAIGACEPCGGWQGGGAGVVTGCCGVHCEVQACTPPVP